MRRMSWLLLGFWLGLIIGCRAPSASAPASSAVSGSAPLTVFAAASLREAFVEIGQQFEQRSGIQVVFNFAGSQQLAQQLRQGAPADVFASANTKEMDNAIAAGAVISGTEEIFARNRLVVILPNDNPARIATLPDLARPGVKLIFAAEQVPIGDYTRQALTKMSTDPAFGENFHTRVNANVVSQEESVKSVVTKISLGEADAGIAYTSDVTPALRGRIATMAIPDSFNQIAAYPIAPLVDAPTGEDLARQFVAFVLSPEGQRIMRRYNFLAAHSGP